MSRLERYWRLWRTLPDDERRARAGRVLERTGRRLGLLPDQPRWSSLRRALDCDLNELCERLRDADPRRGPLFDDTLRIDDVPDAQTARAILERRLELLGAPARWPETADGGIDWHVDWRSGRRWPDSTHHSRIELVRGDGSDVRLPWELARFRHLVTLGLAGRTEPDGLPAERCTSEVREQIDDWIRANPPGMGIHWSSTMEVALRAMSWIGALALCGGATTWDREFLARLVRSLWVHGRHIRRHLEIGPGGRTTNHYLANLAGLYVLGCALPELHDARAWRTYALDALEHEVEKQVHPDGVSFERTTGYHLFVTELLQIVAAHAGRRGDTLPAVFVDRLERMHEFTAAATRPDGSLPAWGDSDEGRVLPFDLAPRVPGDGRSRLFPDAAVAVMRARGMHVFVPCGSVGTLGLGNHTHNDLLSFTLWADGVEWISDPGTGCYSGDIDVRNRLRSTAAHSGLQLDGLEQNELGAGIDGLFRVEERARPEVVSWSTDERGSTLVARHSGFPNAIHERRFELDLVKRSLAIHDRLDGALDGRTATIRFVTRPGTEVRTDGERACVLERAGRSIRLEMQLPDDARIEIVDAPHSPSYGVLASSRVVEATFRATAAQPCATTVLR